VPTRRDELVDVTENGVLLGVIEEEKP